MAICSNFGYFHKPATEKQVRYIKDLADSKNYKKEIDYKNLTMQQAGRLINELKRV